MTPQDVLLQLMTENEWYIHDLLGNTPQECLYWQPDDKANPIGVLIWHVARACDVFLTRHINNQPPSDELWHKNLYADKTGYDPRGIGVLGWGMMTEYTPEQVEAIPQMSAEVLRAYYDDVMSAVRTYLKNTPIEKLEEPSLGYDGKQPNWFWVRHPLFDMARHIGEMHLIKGLWERQNPSDA